MTGVAPNTIVSRRIDPSESAVLSVTRIEGGHSHNVLPAEVQITGTVRSFDATAQDRIEAALRATCQGMALASGTEVQIQRAAISQVLPKGTMK